MDDDSAKTSEQLRQELAALRQQRALEQAAERIREQVLAMRKSEDLMGVVGVMHQCLPQLGVDSYSTGIVFFDEAGEQVQHYLAIRDMQPYGFAPQKRDRAKEIEGGFYVRWSSESFSQWRSHIPLADERLAAWRASRITEGIHNFTREGLLNVWKAVDPDKADWAALESLIGEVILIHVPFQYGVVTFAVLTVSEQHLPTVQALTESLSLGYLRFLDFQQMEEHNQQLTMANEEVRQALEEKEKAQDALVRSESLAAIGTLVAGTAHELNNPIGAAASLVQTVREMVEENTADELSQDREMIVEHLNFSHRELTRAKDIVTSLLELSRQSQDYTEEVDLKTVAQDALRGLHDRCDADQVAIEEDYTADLPTVQGNFAQLVQVALNLIDNGVDALGDDAGAVALKTYADGDQIVFECRDTGTGMSDEVRQDIFKPFFTTKAPGAGTGLGLYVCHQIVERHGGSMDVDSIQGQGTTVRVRLPQTKEV